MKSNLTKEDTDFFDDLYRNYYQVICKYISVIACNKIPYEDIAQDTFVTAWEKITEVRKHPFPDKWLYKTAKNKTMTTMKKKMTFSEIPTSSEELDKNIAESPDIQSIFDDLEEVLTKQEITLLKQRFVEGYSIKEIASKHNMNHGAGIMKFSRLYKKIRNSFFCWFWCCISLQ